MTPIQLMMTVTVRLRDRGDNFVKCRALLDTCSTANFITERMVQVLVLRVESCSVKVGAIGGINTYAVGLTNITFYSIYNEFHKTISCLTVPIITGVIPNEVFSRESIKIPNKLKLADPQFHVPKNIDLLIGSGTSISLFSIGQLNLSQNGYDLFLQKTSLGWCIVGSVPFKSSEWRASCQLTKIHKQLTVKIEKKKCKSPRTEEESEIHYRLNTTRNSSGRYIVRLPFRENKPDLGNSDSMALRRFHHLLRKFENDPILAVEYKRVMQDYIDAGHMSLTKFKEDDGYYLPHHAVVKGDSLTTKIRVVFDASAKTDKGISLNDMLLTGPTIQDKLFEHLLRIRFHKYIVTADIEKMYRQILIDPEDRRYQRILWLNQNRIEIFELNTVTFGISAAPFLAIRTLKQLADDEGNNFPVAAEVLKKDLYVDDLLTGADSIDEIVQLRDELIALLKMGGFRIRKWSSNHPKIIEFPNERMNDIEFLRDDSTIKKTLGVLWDATNDQYLYTVNAIDLSQRITKRTILSEIAKIFDPMGLMGPIIFEAKVLMQECRKSKVSWDESVNMLLFNKWTIFAEQLNVLNKISVKRYLFIDNIQEFELHGFCDASKLGYGACLYVKSMDKQNNSRVSLLCSKSRVAPLKEISIPRMELNGALLLARLFKEVQNLFKIPSGRIIFWCDSTIVLYWLKKSPSVLKVYEANRVTEIQGLNKVIKWRHVRSKDNPADCLSRGQTPKEFLKNKLCFEGPSWLRRNERFWPKSMSIEFKDPPGLKEIVCLTAQGIQIDLFSQISSYRRLIRVFAYCYRFLKSNNFKGNISVEELNLTEKRILRNVQSISFSSEIKQLNKENNAKGTRLEAFDPFLNENGLLCVGGRLKNSDIAPSQKHSILLPSKSHVTDLIITDFHESHYHAGIQATLYAIRYRFWILDGRNQVRRIIHRCVRCIRHRAKPVMYKMGNLPKPRVEASTPFYHTGVDYFGPFFVKEKKHRNRNRVKVYGCVFVCMAIKAVHIEIVSDLTTEAFIGALRRFISRRAVPGHIYSDNGSNFIGANRKLREIYALLETDEHKLKLEIFCNNNKILLHFNPPLLPTLEVSGKQQSNHSNTILNALLEFSCLRLKNYVHSPQK
ncbi:uncharacterized protein [Prorops nasuta]|uniref:uncharacterized protein n=1 Tax=Prorops nasuta TaxID=863751 RepID=UPI0034CD3816